MARPDPFRLPDQRRTLRTAQDLVAAAVVPSDRAEAIAAVAARYAVAITPTLADLIDRADPDDPIARQFVPDPRELDVRAEERPDPIGDHAHSPVDGLVHRYPDRVLLKLVHVCAVYCRFCFRREMVGPGGDAMSAEQLDAAIAYIAARPQIWEVILTGGDPLVLAPRRLAEAMARLAAIPHVKIVRIHTRLPVADPARITPALIGALKHEGVTTYIALHANHPRELTDDVRAACARIVDAGIPMLSQTVLLKGVNDDVATLATLMRGFVECRIKPYYLHHADLAPGTAHLRTSVAEGQELMRALRGRVSGLAQPTYVLDIPGGYGKVPIGPAYWHPSDEEQVTDPDGRVHTYPPDGGA